VLVDYHCHLALDDVPLGPEWMTPEHVERYAAAARERGIAELALTEHVYRFTEARGISPHPFWDETAFADVDAYVAAVAASRDAGSPLRVGMELDWIPGAEDRLRGMVEGRDLDIVLGSVHWLAEGLVDHPGYSVWEHRGVEEVWALYMAELRRAALSGLYDVMAHPDLAKVFGHRPAGGVSQREWEETADAFAEAGVACEISTAGLRKAAGELYPAPELLAACRRRGVPITLAADAHRPEDVGRDVDQAVRLAHEAGYRTVTAFHRREPRQEPLG
jgi:histidinol-phosphatase (PHP family)